MHDCRSVDAPGPGPLDRMWWQNTYTERERDREISKYVPAPVLTHFQTKPGLFATSKLTSTRGPLMTSPHTKYSSFWGDVTWPYQSPHRLPHWAFRTPWAPAFLHAVQRSCAGHHLGAGENADIQKRKTPNPESHVTCWRARNTDQKIKTSTYSPQPLKHRTNRSNDLMHSKYK